ncbi:MAG: histidine phosphatase family protein [Acidimicrobiales bacterium]
MPSYHQTRYAPPAGALDLLLVRHGASEAYTGTPFALVDGHGDPALAPEGVDQAAQAADRLAAEDIDAVYVTNLRRTAETAAPLLSATGLRAAVEADLREVFLGEWEGGVLREKFALGDPISIKVLESERWDSIPSAEPAAMFAGRVRGAVQRLAVRHPGQRVVAFTHGGVIAEILHQATGSRPFAFSGAENCSISEVVVLNSRWSVRRFNDTAHLGG